MTATDIILIIGAVSLLATNIITALKIKEAAAAVSEIKALTAENAALTKSLAVAQRKALAQSKTRTSPHDREP